jgi:eukaryotic-like serine/threonine-protein kinase
MDTQPTIVGGRYELEELLGRGGMAEVRKGTDTRLGRIVAVKRLRTDLASDATFQARFRREAQSSASLNHPAIVAVYDTGEEPTTEGPSGHRVAQPYIVMEYVAGRTLRDILREGRKILPERALEITSGVLSALDYSHRAGIIHRDIKPGNVMLTPSGDVKVMDFGIARAISDASSAMTQTAAVVGTAQYLSPEQARGETVDSRSDVYSAGCLLYELLTGRPPFVGDSPVAVAYQHVREPAMPPSDHDTDLPPEVDAIVMKALAKRLEDRYQSAAEMRNDIERYLAGRPVEATVPPPSDTATAVVPPTPGPTDTQVRPAADASEEEGDRRNKALLWVVLGALVIALVAAAFLLWPRLFEEAPVQEQVPDVVGLTEERARTEIGDAGLSVGTVDHEASDDVEAGLVIRQSPAATDFVDPGTEVDLVISLGPPEKAVPSVLGSPRREARSILEGEGFRVKVVEEPSDEDRNEVIRQDPAAGTLVQENSVITIYYSDGPEEVPNVVGMNQQQAVRAIEEAGFKAEVVESDDTTEDKGTVFRQIPESGQTQPEGTTITIFVSTYEEPTEEPTTEEPTDETPPTTPPTLVPPED